MTTHDTGERVQFVCVRAEHHRRRVASLCVRELAGWRGYCPAGDVGDHDWLPASADLSTLMRLGWIPRAGEPLTEDEPQGDPILIR